MRSTSSPRAVSIRIGVAYDAPSLRNTSNPPTLGSMTSRITISNSPACSSRKRVAAVVHALHIEVLGAQIFGQHLTQLAIVVDQQHARLAAGHSVGGSGRHTCAYFGTLGAHAAVPRENSQFLTDRCVLHDTCLHAAGLRMAACDSTTGAMNMKSIRNLLADGTADGRSGADRRCRHFHCERGR